MSERNYENYYCLTCGFSTNKYVDDPTLIEVHLWNHHKEELKNTEGPSLECPACHGYKNVWGGRKLGKVEMPDFDSIGTIQHEHELLPEGKTVFEKFQEIEGDFQLVLKDRAQGKLTNLRSKYGARKLWGYSLDDLLERYELIRAKQERKKARTFGV